MKVTAKCSVASSVTSSAVRYVGWVEERSFAGEPAVVRSRGKKTTKRTRMTAKQDHCTATCAIPRRAEKQAKREIS